MVCEEYEGDLAGLWVDGHWIEAVTCPYDLTIGPLTFGLFVYGSVMLGLYIRTQSFVVPMVVTIVAGTVAISRIPSRATQIMLIAVFLIMTVAVYFLYQRVQNVA